MKKMLVSLFALLLVMPMLALAEPIVMVTLGISVDLPEGYVVQQEYTAEERVWATITRNIEGEPGIGIMISRPGQEILDMVRAGESPVSTPDEATTELVETEGTVHLDVIAKDETSIIHYILHADSDILMTISLIPEDEELTREEIADYRSIVDSIEVVIDPQTILDALVVNNA